MKLTDTIDLYHADCTDKTLFSEEFIDLTITSPPYNVNKQYNQYDDNMKHSDYENFIYLWLSNVYKWTKPQGRLCLNIPFQINKTNIETSKPDALFIPEPYMRIAMEIGWKYKLFIVWDKKTIPSRTAWGSWKSASAPQVIVGIESILVFYKGSWKKGKGESDITRDEFIQWTDGMWCIGTNNSKRSGHPAAFPLALPERCIKLFSFVGDTIFDPFSGSGTTLEAVYKLNNRKGVGVEIDSEYIELIKNKINSKILI